MNKVIGIDIGGTEIKGAILNDDYFVIKEAKEKTNAANGISAIIASLDAVISSLLENESGILGIGVASAGNINSLTGEVIYATDNLPGYTGFNITSHITKKFKLMSVAENDAYAALIGEMEIGAAKEFNSVVMLTLGTGVGGAIALNREILHGKSYTAGRLGHAVLVPNGKKCNCGQNGCVEKYLSGTAFTEGAKELGYKIGHGSEIFELIKAGNQKLTEYLKDYLSQLATFVDTIINFVNPEAIIIGGGMSSTDFWFKDFFMPLVKNKPVIIKKATLKNRAGIIGAAKLAFSNFMF